MNPGGDLNNENKERHNTNNKWIVWYHNPSDKDWSISSYKDILEISCIEDFWVLKNSWNKCLPKIYEGMFFLMRKIGTTCIYPQWEDPNNKNGGYWSFKVTKDNAEKIWFELMMFMLGECITNNNIDSLGINGISISPKKNFCILKIWNNDSNICDKNILSSKLTSLNMNEVLYSTHKKNIEKDQYKIKRREYFNKKKHYRKKYNSYDSHYRNHNDYNRFK